MAMRHCGMRMQVLVRCARINGIVVVVLVVFVVQMTVRMRHRLMGMFMFVVLGQVQPDAECHQRASHPERWRRGFIEP